MCRMATLLAGAALLCPLGPALAQSESEVNAHIVGVPFVSWQEMRGATFPGSDVVNPSMTAAAQMMYGYWGADFVALARERRKPPDWDAATADGATLDELKALIRQGLPVVVSPATTPDAHRLYLVPKMCAVEKKLQYTGSRPTSGSLGEMVPLEALNVLREGGCEVGLNDSVYLASRLVIGYDDARGMFTFHDPSLGPNLEISYEEFERMWRATGARYWAAHPKEIPGTPAGRADEIRGRTFDDDAAVELFRSYGRCVLGDYAGAETHLRNGLALEGLSPGRRHLLHLELAVALSETGRGSQAIEELRQANAAFGEYRPANALLARLLRESDGGSKTAKEAKQIERRLDSLCSAAVQRRVADELGRDFHVLGCKGELLGWYRP